MFSAAVSIGDKLILAGGSIKNFLEDFYNLEGLKSDVWSLTYNQHEEVVWDWDLLNEGQIYAGGHTISDGVTKRSGQVFMFGGFQLNSVDTAILGADRELVTLLGTSTAFLSNTLSVIRPACKSGTASPDFSTVDCSDCAVGSFAPQAGQTECIPCPPGTTTESKGSTQGEQCNICESDQCSGHGSCRVAGGVPDCRCDVGYAGSQCSLNLARDLGLSLFFGLIFLIGVAYLLRRYSRRVKVLKNVHELQEMLLSESQNEIEALTRAWVIDPVDVDIVKPLSRGGYGEVFLCRWQGRECALKRLHKDLAEIDESSVDEFEHEVKFMRTLRFSMLLCFLSPQSSGIATSFGLLALAVKVIINEPSASNLPQMEFPSCSLNT